MNAAHRVFSLEAAPGGSELAVKLAGIAGIYIALYFSFGRMIAWQNPALRDMYDAASYPEIFSLPKMLGLQALRSLLWVLFAWPVLRTLRGRPVTVALIVGLLYALPMNIVHILPNPFMPDPAVRLSHFIETSTSNFIFGLVVVWLLHRSHSSFTDLFRDRVPSVEPAAVNARSIRIM